MQRFTRQGCGESVETVDEHVRGGRRPGIARILALILFSSIPVAAAADDAYLDMVAAGRFDAIVQRYRPIAEQGGADTSQWHALCLAYGKLKDYDRIFSCTDVLLKRAASGQRASRLFGTADVVPVANLLAAEAYLELGRYGVAARSAEAVVNWFRDSGRRDNEILADAVSILALCAHRLGLTADAERYLRLLERIPVEGLFTIRRAQALARTALTLGNPQKARAALEGRVAASIRSGLSTGVGSGNWAWDALPRAYLYAKALADSGATAEARPLLAEIVKLPEVRQNGEIFWLAHYDLGAIAAAAGSRGEAIAHLREAIATIERQRSTIRSEANKIGFTADRHDVYGKLVELLMAEARHAEAAEIIDRASSRALVDILAERLLQPGASDRGGATDTIGALAERFLQARRQAPRGEPGSTAPALFASAAAFDNLEGVAALSSDQKSVLSVQPHSIAELRTALQDDEIAVQYFVHAAAVSIVWFDRSRVGGALVPAPGLYSMVREFRDAIARRPGGRSDDPGVRLHRLLIGSIPAVLEAKRLVVVPAGPLHYLPFAALSDGEQPLVARASLLTLPSLGVLKLLRTPDTGRPTGAGMLAIGNPDLGSRERDLPAAQREVEDLSRLVQADVLVRADASRTRFLGMHDRYRILHFASHGEYDNEVPLRSRLLLAPGPGQSGELRAEEIMQLRVSAELVTMSACETGLAVNLRGDELIGLNRAWLYAGARNVLASLWSVDDDATALLMGHFYRLLATRDAETALRLAQVEVRKSHPRPYHWAGFYLSGRGGTVTIR